MLEARYNGHGVRLSSYFKSHVLDLPKKAPIRSPASILQQLQSHSQWKEAGKLHLRWLSKSRTSTLTLAVRNSTSPGARRGACAYVAAHQVIAAITLELYSTAVRGAGHKNIAILRPSRIATVNDCMTKENKITCQNSSHFTSLQFDLLLSIVPITLLLENS